jgi:ribonuclease HI
MSVFPPVIAYTDGSGTVSNKTAGIGVVIYEKGKPPLFIAENIGNGTNNRAELAAIYRALKQFPEPDRRIQIYSDSEYAIGSVTLTWAPQVNQELIQCIRVDLAQRHEHYVQLIHVDGHSGIAGNEIADSLAKIGRKFIKDVTKYP